MTFPLAMNVITPEKPSESKTWRKDCILTVRPRPTLIARSKAISVNIAQKVDSEGSRLRDQAERPNFENWCAHESKAYNKVLGSLERLVRRYRVRVEIPALKESAEERGCVVRDADNLV